MTNPVEQPRICKDPRMLRVFWGRVGLETYTLLIGARCTAQDTDAAKAADGLVSATVNSLGAIKVRPHPRPAASGPRLGLLHDHVCR